MSVEILMEITASEEKAEQIEIQAAQKAKELISAARKEAAEAMNKAISQAENEARNVIKANEERAFLDINQMKLQTMGECNIIKEKSREKLNVAVDFIVGRIVNL